ncbi:diaminopropionate ammonia-lyase [Humitalea sp. 24SJ18S-53]|uniref:diaminopropionate ammonia-lyase n=1 Tax=Humitalea sp. 24SJ18S-53 TaxID=3422307 RepID=UPI003D66EFDA
MTPKHVFRLVLNKDYGIPGTVTLPDGGFRRAKAEITSWPGYAPTPLLPLADFAAEAGVAEVWWKDESQRFGLGSFKALGGAYAVLRVLVMELAKAGIAPNATSADLIAGRYAEAVSRITITCATDGNHGRSVAWGAQRFGAACMIFVHPTVSQGRRDAIAAWGAEVREVPGNYDDAVRAAAEAAALHGWHVVSDTSWPGYTEIPRDVMQGYRLMVDEACDQLAEPPTHAFIQAGVGGVAAAVAAHLRGRYPDRALTIVVVEPERAACIADSLEAGKSITVGGDLDTIMAGLACGEPSLLAWQELSRSAWAAVTIPDAAAAETMRALARRDPPIVAGESGVAGLAALMLVTQVEFAAQMLWLRPNSRVLLFGTEGATDPDLYASIIAS